MADTYGLLLLMVVFLSAQLFVRNYMFSIFRLSTTSANSSSSQNLSSSNKVKSLSISTSALSHVTATLRSGFSLMGSQLRGK